MGYIRDKQYVIVLDLVLDLVHVHEIAEVVDYLTVLGARVHKYLY